MCVTSSISYISLQTYFLAYSKDNVLCKGSWHCMGPTLLHQHDSSIAVHVQWQQWRWPCNNTTINWHTLPMSSPESSAYGVTPTHCLFWQSLHCFIQCRSLSPGTSFYQILLLCSCFWRSYFWPGVMMMLIITLCSVIITLYRIL